MTRRVLVVSFYFEPDLSAGSFRATALVDALLRESPDVRVDVVTSLPHRYGSFTSEASAEERSDRRWVRRINLPAHRSGMRDQTRSFIHFAREALRLTRGETYDVVFATSSRLMTAALGARIARRAGAPLYLDIRDIFVETIADVLPRRAVAFVRPLAALAERWTIGSAARVNLVSPGFEPYFVRRYPAQSFSYFTNGVDDEFLASAPVSSLPKRGKQSGDCITVLYAGNIGEGQGLQAILPGLAQRLGDRASFVVIGDGGRRRQLEEALVASGVGNVELRPPVSRSVLIDEYLKADVLLLHLNDYPAFERVLPSKIFEYAALGKPILAGVAGYAAKFIAAEVVNAAVFTPCDAADAVDALSRLRIADASRPEFVRKYRRATIARELAGDILSIARSRGSAVARA